MSGILGAVTQRAFWSESQIRQLVRDSDEKIERIYKRTPGVAQVIPLTDLRAMLIFTAEKEQTWLVADNQGRACLVLDDRRRERPEMWRIKPGDALPVHVNETWTERSGVLQFGKGNRKWLYSKELFLSERPEDAISRFLSPTDDLISDLSSPAM